VGKCEQGKEPGKCSPEQIKECHGDQGHSSCPEGKDPKECSPEQVKKCHGDVKKHPCC